MPAIRETLVLEDLFSATFGNYIVQAQKASGQTEELRIIVKNMGASAEEAAAKMSQSSERMGKSIGDTAKQAEPFLETLRMSDRMIKQTQASMGGAGVQAQVYAQRLLSTRTQIAQMNATLTIQRQMLKEVIAAEGGTSAASLRLAQDVQRTVTQMEDMQRETRVLESQLNQVAGGANGAARAIRQIENSAKGAGNPLSSLTSQIKGLVGAYVGVQSIQGLFNLSDQMTGATARLNMIVDDGGSVDELEAKIMASANRARASYLDTAAAVSQMGVLAGDAFGNNDELIAFTETINKQFAIAGTTAEGTSAAMLQITQAMSSGVLRGEELNSVFEQAPNIVQNIADYLGVGIGEIREMASEGQITSEIFKNSMLAAAQEVDAQFQQMPMTWGQVWNIMQNVALQAIQPILDGINWLANNIDQAILWIQDNLNILIPVLAAITTAVVLLGVQSLKAGAQMMLSGLQAAAAWAMANLPILLVAAAIGAVIFIARQAGATWEQIGGVIGGVFMSVYAFAMNQMIIPLQRNFAAFANFFANLFNDPVASVKILFYDLAQTVLGYIRSLAGGLETLINAIPGVEINLTSGIDDLYNRLEAASNAVKENSSWQEVVKPWEYMDYGEAWNTGYSTGANLGSKLDNLDLTEMFSGLMGGGSGSGIGTGVDVNGLQPSLDTIGQDVGSIKKEVSMSEEDIKSLVDMAERQYVNNINLTSQTPVITVNATNNNGTPLSAKDIANAVRDILIEQSASSSVRTTARVF